MRRTVPQSNQAYLLRRSHCWFCRYAGAGVPVGPVTDWVGLLLDLL